MFTVPQSTSYVCMFKAFLSSDHVSEAMSKTIAITISKNGGAFGNPNAGATNATEVSSGWYKVTLDTTDTGTVGPLAVRGAVATVDDVGVLLNVVKATNGGWTALPDTAVTTNASLLTSGTSTAQLSVASGQVTVATNNDKTGYSLSVTPPTAAAVATAVWTDTTAGDFTTSLSVGKSLMNGVSLGTGLTINDLTTKTGFSLAVAPPTSAAIATAVWGDTTAGDFTVSASVGKSLMNGVALGSALHIALVDTVTTYTGDTPQTGDAYARLGAPAGASVSADVAAIKSDTGTILTDVNTGAGAIYTRIGAPVGASISADIAAVNAKTTNLPASPSAVGSAMTLTIGERNSVADALLDRDMSTGTDSGSTTVRTVRQALRFLRNKWAVVAGVVTVYKEDDSTASWTAALSTDAAAVPVIGSDPAGP